MKKIGKYWYCIIALFVLFVLAIEYQIPWRVPAGKHGDWLGFWGSVIGSAVSTLLAAGIAYFVTKNENDRVSRQNADIAREQFILTKKFEAISNIDAIVRSISKKLQSLYKVLPNMLKEYTTRISSDDVNTLIQQKDNNSELDRNKMHDLKSAIINAEIVFRLAEFSWPLESEEYPLRESIEKDFEAISSSDIGLLADDKIYDVINEYHRAGAVFLFSVLDLFNDLALVKEYALDDIDIITNLEVTNYYENDEKINLDQALRSQNNDKSGFSNYANSLSDVQKYIEDYRKNLVTGENKA